MTLPDSQNVELVEHNPYVQQEERRMQADGQNVAECGMMEAGAVFANPGVYEQPCNEVDDGVNLEEQGHYEFMDTANLENAAVGEPVGRDMETTFTDSGDKEGVEGSEKGKEEGQETSLTGKEAPTSCSKKELGSITEGNEETSSAGDDSLAAALLPQAPPQATGEREDKSPEAEEDQGMPHIRWDDISPQLLNQRQEMQEKRMDYGEEDAAL